MTDEERQAAETMAFMEMAEAFQRNWSMIVSMMTGAVKEMTDQGWPEDHSRALVLTLYMNMVSVKQ